MKAITAMNVVRDSLRTNLADPYSTYMSGSTRAGWIYTDEPLPNTKYPRIQIQKTETSTDVIDIGMRYCEHEQLFMDVWFYTKKGMKATIGGVTYENEQLVDYYQSLIQETLKADNENMYDEGVGGYRHLRTTDIGYDPETQIHYGAVKIRVWYFNQG